MQAGLDGLLQESESPVGLAIVTLLAWIALADGSVSAEEQRELLEVAAASPRLAGRSRLMEILEGIGVDELEAACRALRSLTRVERRLVLDVALGIAIADRRLAAAENIAIRFVADGLGFDLSTLDEAFREVANRVLPPLDDPSSPEWWRRREGGSRVRASRGGMTRVRALAILGLEEEQDPRGIREAYRRLAQIHHPDRFESLGPESVAAATLTFRRIQEAYDLLASR